MSWKNIDLVNERVRFAQAALAGEKSFGALCREHAISRVTGYKWLGRYERGGEGAMVERSHRPQRSPGRARGVKEHWVEEALTLRLAHPSWGARKLRASLRRAHPLARLPSVMTLWRRLTRAGAVEPQPARSRRGPKVERSGLWPAAGSPNEVWTVDLKGNFRVGSGQSCLPLTIRDQYSRYVLVVEHLAQPSEEIVRLRMRRAFERHGMPGAILVDNGSPFGGAGALGLTRLSVWWTRLHIAVRFTRPAHPQDNGAHEQMHKVLKAETATPPAASLGAQHERFVRWRRHYNHERPHEALEGRVPADVYHRSRRNYRTPKALCYRTRDTTLLVRPGGRVQWHGRPRLIGRAFAGEQIGLRPLLGTAQAFEVYLGDLLIGEMHTLDKAGMRPAYYQRKARPDLAKKVSAKVERQS